MKLTPNSIREHVDAGSFQRGRSYFTSGHVISCTVEDSIVYGKVAGSERTPYETEFAVEDEEIIDSQCSCPIGGSCKHVVALALKALIQVANKPVQPNNQGISPQKKQAHPKWMDDLQKLIEKNDVGKKQMFQLQMLLAFSQSEQQYSYEEIARSLMNAGYSRRTNRQVNKQKIRPPEPIWTIELRPRLYNPLHGSVSVSDVRWESASYGNTMLYWNGTLGTLSEEQTTYLQLLCAGVRQYGSGWEKVAGGKERYIWKLLQEHTQYDVPLLGGKKGQMAVQIFSSPIMIMLQVDETSDGVLIHRQLSLEGKSMMHSLVALVGDPAVFAAIDMGDHIALHPVLSHTKGLSTFHRSVLIPKSDIPLLQEKVMPTLAKKVTMRATTGLVVLPQTVDPQPVISVKHAGETNVTVLFGMRYQDRTYPLHELPDHIIDQGKTLFFNQRKTQEFVTLIDSLRESLMGQEMPAQSSTRLTLKGMNAARFIAETIPELRKKMPDVIVEIPTDLPHFELDTSTPDIVYEVSDDASSYDWFDLHVQVKIGEEHVPFHELFTALVEGYKYMLLQSGKYFSLSTSQFERLRQLLIEAKSIQEKGTDDIQLTRFHAGLWDELQRTGIVAKQAARWQETMKGLLAVENIPLQSVAKNMQATLRPYQMDGYSWLSFLRMYQLGGILADDMGLGKTIQTIALMTKVREEQADSEKQPFLVVAPTSVVENWDAELQKFAPTLSRSILRAGNRSKQLKDIAQVDVVVISYALLIRDYEQLHHQQFDTIFFDEAQMVKNHQSKAYGIARKLQADCKIALTGTPMENNLMELWAICSLVAPGLLPPPERFTIEYRIPIEKQQNTEVLARLRQRIRPILLRRQKSVVATQLPQKNEQVLLLPLNKDHSYIYEKHLQYERKRVLGLLASGGLKEHRFEVLRSLTKLRQLCLHPALVDTHYDACPSTKLDALREYVEELVAEKHRVLIFSQFTSFLRLVRATLDREGYRYLYLAGETKKRGELIATFQKDMTIPIFLISLKAGGFGLNLTSADYCILLDPWWNPAVEEQAIARTHRIGQEQPVFVYKLIAKNTIEEKVLALQEKKRALFHNVLDEKGFFTTIITEEEIRQLFR